MAGHRADVGFRGDLSVYHLRLDGVGKHLPPARAGGADGFELDRNGRSIANQRNIRRALEQPPDIARPRSQNERTTGSTVDGSLSGIELTPAQISFRAISSSGAAGSSVIGSTT